jgi:hypothetical protein
MKKCPYCAEEIQDDAIKCKHCGEWLNTQETLEGLRGWLIVVGIIFWLNFIPTFHFFFLIDFIFDFFGFDDGIFKDYSNLQPVIGITVILGIIRVIPLIILIVGFHKKTKYILRIFKQFLFCHFLFLIPYSACFYAISVGLISGYFTFNNDVVLLGVTSALIINIMLFSILYLYLLKSRRSKNTFTIDINPWIPIPK